MFKGFREFILRGNVIDLAVAVVIGTAFSAVVTSIVSNIFNPLIGALFNASSLDKVWIVSIPLAAPGATPAEIHFGTVLATIIQFLLVALVVYFAIIVPINYLSKVAFQRRKKEEAEEASEPVPPTELELLAQIRDLLAQAQPEPGSTHGKHDVPEA